MTCLPKILALNERRAKLALRAMAMELLPSVPVVEVSYFEDHGKRMEILGAWQLAEEDLQRALRECTAEELRSIVEDTDG